ncbi:MAG: alginate export family protein [Kiritimatiellae bacterium]|nr:alginate export family protein [Kiritimatiellia bacterium]
MKAIRFPVAVLALAGAAALSDEVPAAAPETLSFRAGGDLRLRQEAFDHIPIKTAEPSVTRGGRNDYFRVRPRLFAGVDFGDWLSLDARLCDEFRIREAGQESYEWPDELIVDRLELSLRGLFDGRVDLTLGRQDVSLGSGRLFAEGTAKDGSRTGFFDGALARVRVDEKRTLDLFGFYGRCENKLAVGHEHRDLTGLAPGWNGMDEATAGFFYDDRALEELGWGVYYVWLHDTAWRTRAGDRVPHEDVHTFGARLLPRFSDEWSAEFEGALQWSGSDGYDRRAGFATGGLKWSFAPGVYVSANALWLSGDDPDTARREDFNVLFGRYPWISELLLYAFDADGVGTWHDISHAWLEIGGSFGESKAHKVRATAGPVFAPERDGAGGGRDRGWLETVRYTFPVWSAQGLTGHLFLEVFEPGDYYVSDRTAYFARWELNWAF